MTDGQRISLERVFPNASADLQKLFRGAAESGLEAIDFYTIKDLQDLSGYHDEELARLLVCLFLALREGSVCIDLDKRELLRRLEGVLDPESASASVDAMLLALRTKRYSELIGGNEDESKPLIRRTVNKREFLYFQKYLRHERALRVLLDQRLALPQQALPQKTLQKLFTATLAAHAAAGIEFSAEQKLGIALSLLRNFVVISGGPGTGKTSVIFALLQCLVRSGTPPDRILLACPTGRAAQRLTESLRTGAARIADSAALSGLAAQTLHRLLGYNPKFGTFNHHRENQLPAEVLIVDEVSMMDVVLMSRFLEAAPPGAKVILLGDKDQLPSVDAGSVLADLMPADGKPTFSSSTGERLRELTGIEILHTGRGKSLLADGVVILQKNFRSQQHITEVTRAINDIGDGGLAKARKIVETLPALKLKAAPTDSGAARYVWPRPPELKQTGVEQAGGCYLLNHPHQHDEWREILNAWADFHYAGGDGTLPSYRELVESLELPDDAEFSAEAEAQLAKIFSVVNGARVLTLLRDGLWGCQGVNLHLARRLATRDRRGTAGAFPGAPILITANDYTLNVFNGDVGVALQTGDGALRVVFERQDDTGGRRCLSLPLDILPQHELAFAMTVHKSQGSEYGQVLLAIPPEGGQRLQNRQLVYTAITRARQLVVCYGAPSVLSAAIGRGLERCSGLSSELA